MFLCSLKETENGTAQVGLSQFKGTSISALACENGFVFQLYCLASTVWGQSALRALTIGSRYRSSFHQGAQRGNYPGVGCDFVNGVMSHALLKAGRKT